MLYFLPVLTTQVFNTLKLKRVLLTSVKIHFFFKLGYSFLFIRFMDFFCRRTGSEEEIKIKVKFQL